MPNGQFRKGNVPWNKKKYVKTLCLVCKKVILTPPSVKRKYCQRKCYWDSKKGIKLSIKTRLKMSKYIGKKRYNFKGKKAASNQRARNRIKIRIWRDKIFKRDNYTCQICKKRGGILNADHILPWALFPKQRFTLKNGRTLCINCHKKTKSYLNPWMKKEDYE
jgi:hypothetical protein